MPTITTSSYNPRTVLTAMFNDGEHSTEFVGSIYGSYNSPAIETSDGVMTTTQGDVAIVNSLNTWPLYIHVCARNMTTLRRHPNTSSHVMYFNKANGSFICSQRFQEFWPGQDTGWTYNGSDYTTLAWPDQVLTIDSANPGAVLYTSGSCAFKNVPGVRFPGNSARAYDPLRRGNVPVTGNAKDRIVMTIRNGDMLNEFIVRYDFYTSAFQNGNAVAYSYMFYVDGALGRFNRIMIRDAVVTAIDPVTGLFTKRTDTMDGKRMELMKRVSRTYTALAATPSTVTHGNPVILTATITSGAGTPGSGIVRFYDVDTLITNAPVNSQGVATASYTWNSTGSKAVYAYYGGDGSNWGASQSVPISVIVQ